MIHCGETDSAVLKREFSAEIIGEASSRDRYAAPKRRGGGHKKGMNPMRPDVTPREGRGRLGRNYPSLRQNGRFEPVPLPAITSCMSSLTDKLQETLAARDGAGLRRRLRQDSGGVDFSSNDYLGLSRSAELADRIEARLAGQGAVRLGSTGSRLISGNSAGIEALEAQIARFHKAPASLLFGSGYAANTGVFSCLLGAGDTLILDELIHASMIDGARLSKADRIVFKHNDLESLEQALHQAKGTKVIGIESVYSMDGDVAPLQDIVALAEQVDAAVVIDEAHSTGVMGPDGSGLVVAQGLEERIFARVHTFGKAVGLHGAAVVGSNLMRDYLMNFARPFVYATAPSPHMVAAISAAYDLLPGIEAEREKLFGLIKYFRRRLVESRHQWLDSTTWIQALIVPGNAKVRGIADELRSRGFWTVPIVSPTVPVGMERIRLCLHSFNTEAEIDQLHEALDEIAVPAKTGSMT